MPMQIAITITQSEQVSNIIMERYGFYIIISIQASDA